MEHKSSTLYIVATPIGNLADISLRALSVLRSVDYIVCEDTRVTAKLLGHYEIEKSLLSWHSQSGPAKVDKMLSLLKEGKNLALVCDAGTPAISDPGSFLVAKVKEEFGDEISVVAIPGASALTTALSVAGLPVSDFLFLGFLPHKKGRETLFKEIVDSKRTVVFYESVHRIVATLEKLSSIISDDRSVVVCRELTKVYEEIISGSAKFVLNYYLENKDKVRGEFVVLVAGK